MARKKTIIPEYGTTTIGTHQYYRTRITDADGKQYALYTTTREEFVKAALCGFVKRFPCYKLDLA